MNATKIKRFYEIRQQIKELEAEAKLLGDEIKDRMLKENIHETTIGNFHLLLQRQDRSEMKETIVQYLKDHGHSDLIVETYDREMFKELEKRGRFDKNELEKYKIEKIVYALYVKPA